MIEGLTVTKEADKQNWASGNLTYTITINNSSATSGEYSYDSSINLGDISPSTSSKIMIQVKKKSIMDFLY